MSWRIANECAERRFGSAARKQIIMFLADKASDDGSGIWVSKGNMALDLEMKSKRTVQTNIADLVDEDSFVEYGPLVIAPQRRRRELQDLIDNTPADGMVTGIGTIKNSFN